MRLPGRFASFRERNSGPDIPVSQYPAAASQGLLDPLRLYEGNHTGYRSYQWSDSDLECQDRGSVPRAHGPQVGCTRPFLCSRWVTSSHLSLPGQDPQGWNSMFMLLQCSTLRRISYLNFPLIRKLSPYATQYESLTLFNKPIRRRNICNGFMFMCLYYITFA